MKRYKLDPYPKGETILYINNLQFLYPTGYTSQEEHEEAFSRKTKSENVVLPDDNVRIFIPLDLNAT